LCPIHGERRGALPRPREREGGLAGRCARALLTRPVASRVYGSFQRAGRTRSKVESFARAVGIDPSDAARPLSSFESIDDFFARRLREGARPVDPEPTHLVSPADARVLVYPRLSGALLPVKGARVPLEDLLADRVLAARYERGSAIVLRLAVADYHRFHFPDSGTAGPWREAGTRLDSVHPIALASGAPSFLNKRQVSELATERFGRIAQIEVGAICVGTIVQTYTPGPVRRGAEKGFFRFGGSTVVLVAEEGAVRFDEDLVASSGEGLETLVRVGTRIACSA
jgi:phosphatidylserine decarboxylase